MFAVTHKQLPEHVAVLVRGELDMAAAPELLDFIAFVLPTAAATSAVICLDLALTTFLDSSGVRAIMTASRRATVAGVKTFVYCPAENGHVRRIMELTQLATAVPVVDTPTPPELVPPPLHE